MFSDISSRCFTSKSIFLFIRDNFSKNITSFKSVVLLNPLKKPNSGSWSSLNEWKLFIKFWSLFLLNDNCPSNIKSDWAFFLITNNLVSIAV